MFNVSGRGRDLHTVVREDILRRLYSRAPRTFFLMRRGSLLGARAVARLRLRVINYLPRYCAIDLFAIVLCLARSRAVIRGARAGRASRNSARFMRWSRSDQLFDFDWFLSAEFGNIWARWFWEVFRFRTKLACITTDTRNSRVFLIVLSWNQ